MKLSENVAKFSTDILVFSEKFVIGFLLGSLFETKCVKLRPGEWLGIALKLCPKVLWYNL